LQQSVPSPSDVQATFVATLVDEWCRSGLRDVVVCPGSRSTPLALAFALRPDLTLHVRIDERSAAFFAIGRALATHRPVAIVVTSGTAAAELHAAVAEADLASVPLLVLTADRPPELHGVGAPQTIVQSALFGAMVRRFEEPGVARLEVSGSWRALANRLWSAALGTQHDPGPVHLNAAFVEPLLGTSLELPEGRDEAIQWRVARGGADAVCDVDVRGRRVLAVVGRGTGSDIIAECEALDWVVLGDATAQGSLAYFDTLLRDAAFAHAMKPDLVVRMGGAPASKVLAEQLRAWRAPTVGLTCAGRIDDPDGLVRELIAGRPSSGVERLRADPSYAASWRTASSSLEARLASVETVDDELNEVIVARTVVAMSGELGVALTLGSSMPVRDVEWWSPPRRAATYSNRGANGIDGVVSTVFGVCAGAKGLGLVGDITLLHDVSGLVDGLGETGGSCVLVVNDNRGGGIFSFLPQANALADERFEQLFATPRPHDLEGIARAFGHSSTSVRTRGALRDAIARGLEHDGVTVVIALVPARADNVKLHEALNRDVQVRRGSAS